MRAGLSAPYEVTPWSPRFLVSLDAEVQAQTSEDALDLAVEAVIRRNFTIRSIQRVGGRNE